MQEYLTSLEKLFSEMYYREIDRENKIDDQLSLPIGIVAILSSAAAFYALELFPFNFNVENVLSAAITCLLIIFIIAAIIYLLRAYVKIPGHEYAYIASPERIKSYVEELHEKNAGRMNNAEINQHLKLNLQHLLISHYSKCGEINTKVNEARLNLVFKSKQMIFLSVILLIINSVVFMWIKAFGGN